MTDEIEQFHEALERDAGERVAFIRAKYADDPERARRLIDLVEAHEHAERAEAEAEVEVRRVPVAPVDPMPERIGKYTILERIGEGGMGLVYAAEQTEPFRRRVAVKVIKLGMDSQEVLTRFEMERQALAMMDHPGVAKALDAGVTEQGRPYFVMELVKGLPLIEYCARQRLDLRERLRLFVEVCWAVQHAHQKGIIHRDLKPSNILIALQEGRPVPKVIDFGVAKATAARLTERTVFTAQGRLIGTPEYMSPEQADMSGLDVDTRTDVYSLGVVLYELLTGVLPFDPEMLRSGGFMEAVRLIRDVDPPRPSARLRALTQGSSEPRKDLPTSVRTLRGELDWIVMRAIQKDRTRRYRTANALGEDVERYLTDRPVEAGPPTTSYSIRKFIQRHRYVTGLVGLALFSAVVGLVGVTAGLLRAREAEALATDRAENAQAAADFLEHVLFQADPEFGGRSLTLLEVMDNAGRIVGDDLRQFPETEASVRESLGVAYRRRSMYPEARPHLERALEIRQGLFGDDHIETAGAYVAVADFSFEYEGRIDVPLAQLELARAALASHGLAGTVAEGWLQLDVGIISLAGDRLAQAEQALRRCRDLLARELSSRHPDVSRPIRALALVALARGDMVEAERLALEAVALCDGAGEDYIGARAELVLAQVLIALGRFEEASEQLDRSGGRFYETVGQQHIRIAERQVVLGELHLGLGEFDVAEHISTHCEAMRRTMLHEDHWELLEAGLLVQRARMGQGDLDSVEIELAEIADATRRTLGSDHRLAIRVAEARLACAAAAGDEALRATRAEELAKLKALRADRLRSERGS